MALGMLVWGAPEAAAQPGLSLPPHPGTFAHSNVLVYADPVDGFWCVEAGTCRSADRMATDPLPAWRRRQLGEPVQVTCALGAYDKIRGQGPRPAQLRKCAGHDMAPVASGRRGRRFKSCQPDQSPQVDVLIVDLA
jgi:hypothetical protein